MKNIGLMTKDEALEYLEFDDRDIVYYISGKDKDIRPLPCHKLDRKLVFFFDEVEKWSNEFDDMYYEVASKEPF